MHNSPLEEAKAVYEAMTIDPTLLAVGKWIKIKKEDQVLPLVVEKDTWYKIKYIWPWWVNVEAQVKGSTLYDQTMSCLVGFDWIAEISDIAPEEKN